ncbi:uncharacterized protein LOC119836969 [Zerene cesonia]|uniref:uncharacterized protein LOC119836969 n=1 Tax=Zerene cesonia TaxID=33412 RepID=UPI0018E4E165|nr:uncharacterized protein LOC119836969 [Zerene cesonia]
MAIETFVFFDIETTGLPQFEKNRTKITELTFIGVSRKDIETCTSIPLMNKLSYVFNPEKKIQSEAARITGLSNANLKNQATFKNRIDSLNSYLEQFPKPVCLVAHNGNRFDFKIIRSEYIDANKDLPMELLCIDSMSGFRKIIDLYETNIARQDVQKETPNISTLDESLLTDDEDWPEMNTSKEDWDDIDKLVESFGNMSSGSDRHKSNKKDSKNSLKNKENKVSYKLTELYKRFCKKDPIEAHRAEADCIMLLECVLATKEYFLTWADKNCKLISDIQPLVRK